MKKFFLLLGGWFLAIVCVVGGSYIYSHYQAGNYDDRALPYIREVVPELSQWNPETTRALMTPEVLENLPEERFIKILETFSRMGALRSVGTPEFEKVLSEEQTANGTRAVVAYEVEAEYENGTALISLSLAEEDGHFTVYRFNLSSQALAGK